MCFCVKHIISNLKIHAIRNLVFFLIGLKGQHNLQKFRVTVLMRPRFDPRKRKIICIRLWLRLSLITFNDGKGVSILLSIIYGFDFVVEAKANLTARIWRRRPSHQRIWLWPRSRFEFENPTFRIAAPRLHRILRGSENTNVHGPSLNLIEPAVVLTVELNWSGRLDSNQRLSAPKADTLPGWATPRIAAS